MRSTITTDRHFRKNRFSDSGVSKRKDLMKISKVASHSFHLLIHDENAIVYYVPRRTMRVIARRATMLAGDRSQGVAETKPRRDQSCEHCLESRNFPNCVHWHVFYSM